MPAAQRSQIKPSPLIPLSALPYRRFASRYPDFVQRIADLRASRKRSMARLESLDRRAQRNKVRQLLHSRQYDLVYAYEAILKAKLIGSATPQSIEALAARIDVYTPSHEYVRCRTIRKPDTRVRDVQSFGPLKRARQLFVAGVIRALHPPRANQFLVVGGIPAALKAVEAAYRRGMTHAVELDVTDFYGSIRYSDLAEALRPLPDAVVRHVVFDKTTSEPADVSGGPIGPLGMVPPPLFDTQGLPLGAASSPIAGEVMIGRLLADPEIDFGLDIVAYADNLLVLGRSEPEATARAEHLVAVAGSAACGSLRLREKGRGHMIPPGSSEGGGFAGGVPFVGQIGYVDEAGLFSWEPCAEKRNQHHVADGECVPTLERIERAERQVTAFHRAYPFWQHRALSESEELALLAGARYHRSATPQHLSDAARAIALAYLINRGQFEVFQYIPDYGGSGRSEARRERLATEAQGLIALILGEAGDTAEAA
jgi:hypothetical protein